MIGYGSQGRTHALNLRDSGVTDIVVGLKAGSATRAKAEADGFRVLTAGEATAGADVVAMMVSDEAHRDLYRDEIEPNIKAGAALIFAHGLSVRFGLVTPRADLDVILDSPKGIGPRIRDLYEAGEGVFCLFGVHQDATGGATPWACPMRRPWAAAARAFWKRPSPPNARATCLASRWCFAAGWAN